MSRRKKILLALLSFLLLIPISGVILAYVYEDDVKKYAIAELNKNLTTEIQIQEYNFSFFKKFPYASLEFAGIKAKDAPPCTDGEYLFQFESFYLRFNIFDIFSKRYTIKKIDIENGEIQLKTDKNENVNWQFWKSSADTTPSALSLQLEKIYLKNISFTYLHEKRQQDIRLLVYSGTLSGNFSEDQFDLNAETACIINSWKEKDVALITNREIDLQTTLYVDNTKRLYTLKKTTLSVGNLTFQAAGEVQLTEENTRIAITLSGENHALSDLHSLLPEEEQKNLSDYNISGNIHFSGGINGLSSLQESPEFSFSYRISDGKITEPGSNVSLEHIALDGHFTYYMKKGTRSSKVAIDEMKATFSGNNIHARFTLSDLWNPYLEAELHGHIPLPELKNWLRADTLETLTGTVETNLLLSGFVKSIRAISAEEYRKLKISGKATLQDVSISIANNPRSLKNLNGTLHFTNNDVKTERLQGIVSGSDFQLSGIIRNLPGFLFTQEEMLDVQATLYSENILLDSLLVTNSTNTDPYHLALSPRIKAKINAAIKNISFRKFRAENVSAQVLLRNNILQANSISMRTMQGILNADVEINAQQKDTILISSEAFLQNINLRDFFYQFENFTQESLKSEHINGTLSAEVLFASVFTTSLEIDPAKTYAKSSLTIQNGLLSNYEPIMALSRFISVEELKSIQFSTLSTEIEVKDKTVFIPYTDITSSALNVGISGKHHFSNAIDYRFRILFNELLWRKAKKARKENEEFGYVEDDGTGRSVLFLKMTGTTEKPIISYDTEGLRSKWKEDMKKEKQTLKQILNKEFGWFKKDSTLQETPKPSKKPFTIEWDDEQPEDKPSKEKDSGNIPDDKKKEKEKKGFLQKITQPNTQEYEKFED